MSASEVKTSLALFALTTLSVFATYGWVWGSGDPFGDLETALESAKFAGALMAILLAHELGHYIVGRRHGLDMSPPFFIPAPIIAFGTFGAIIRMRDRPKDRSALLEMGAAGPLAGAVVAILFLALGLPGTVAEPPSFPPPPTPEESGLPLWILSILDAVDGVLSWGPLGWLSDQISPPVPEGHAPVVIFNNPPVMDLLGGLLLGTPPGRFDQLTPLALAGWVGCLLTAINLIPIGQLDGGHVANALSPKLAPRLSQGMLLLALAGGVLWAGWAFWAVLLAVMGASRGLKIASEPGLSVRARVVAAAVLVAFGLTFMPRPIEMDSLPYAAAATD